ncbi:zinc finger protein 28 homolog isoform X2 [Spodoptera litura]|uniref:Zinc finger protein 28 homolog isoform X2 n=1 Tax=Spodoptera litura TaxID=69820 RepID=A0A9J7EDX3_SPOLT|nr:zinc finger protein 28 homolog isoform X2 [Spodoptera litura]
MVDLSSTRLCRVCLQDGAMLPIFEKSENGGNILSKLSLCIQHEKIEDVEGLPRHICTICSNTLDTLCDFINKFKESCKILENGLLTVLKEDLISSNQDRLTEVEINIKNIKAESEDHYDDGFDDYEDLLPLKLPDKIKQEPIKKKSVKKKPIKTEPKPRKVNSQTGTKTNKIASSILEGNFLWNGDKCIKSGSPKLSIKATRESKQPKPRHITIKLSNATKPTTDKLCDLCGNVFKTNDKLSNHKKTVHFKKPIKCPKCPKICDSDYYLHKHMKRKHETNREFICATCGQGFAFRGDLTSHTRNVHEKIKRMKVYSCKFCDKTYKCAKSTIIHERSVHTGQRPAECSVCNTSFYHEDYLKEHMRLHTGETPFKCPICGRGYAQRGNMKSHLRIHRISELDAVTLSKLRPNYLKLLKV